MPYYFAEFIMDDRKQVIDLFNYYIENTMAAYPENKVNYEFYDFIWNATQGYPRTSIRDDNGELIGFAFLRAHNAIPSFKRTAEISCFIKPEHTARGLGKAVLDKLEIEAAQTGIEIILASISSLNESSINFHVRNGFKKCGLFEKVGKKFGQEFDVVWMQKNLNSSMES